MMTCNHCQKENEERALYCRHCGTKLMQPSTPQSTGMPLADIVILVVIACMVINHLYWSLIPLLVENWHELKVPAAIFNMVMGFIPLLLGLGVKNKLLKIVLLVVGALYLLSVLYHVFLYNVK